MVGDSELVAYEINHLVIHKLRHEQVEYRRGSIGALGCSHHSRTKPPAKRVGQLIILPVAMVERVESRHRISKFTDSLCRRPGKTRLTGAVGSDNKYALVGLNIEHWRFLAVATAW